MTFALIIINFGKYNTRGENVDWLYSPTGCIRPCSLNCRLTFSGFFFAKIISSSNDKKLDVYFIFNLIKIKNSVNLFWRHTSMS